MQINAQKVQKTASKSLLFWLVVVVGFYYCNFNLEIVLLFCVSNLISFSSTKINSFGGAIGNK